MSENAADFNQLGYVLGQPSVKAELKAEAEDFVVEELISYPLSGEGEHLWCWVEKRQQNTDWVAGMLAKWADTSKRNVGFAGQKDRHAVTRQWFSIQLPGKADPDMESFAVEGVQILKMVRHNRKLQRGGLAGNRFRLRLKNLEFAGADDKTGISIKEDIEARLQSIQTMGFPNYFGQQRFGWNGNNLVQAAELFKQDSSVKASSRKGKRKRRSSEQNKQGLYISAVRSWMFNELLSQRIEDGNWNELLAGDLLQLEGSNKWFAADLEADGDVLKQRVAAGDLHPSGVLFGDGALATTDLARIYEQSIENRHPKWMDGLRKLRVQPDRRAFRVCPSNLEWHWLEQDADGQKINLELGFELPAGSFATMLLREVVQTYEVER